MSPFKIQKTIVLPIKVDLCTKINCLRSEDMSESRLVRWL